MDNGILLNLAFSLLYKKITVPQDYHEQAKVVKTMLEDDITGLVDSLTDFSVNTANVDFSIETESVELTRILRQWLNTININYKGQIPIGINALAQEYFRERWKGASFPILKITKWKKIKRVQVPIGLTFVDGGHVHSDKLSDHTEQVKLVNYKYYLGRGKKEALDKGVIITKPFNRWHDRYPTPFLVKRGIYHNWRIINALKEKQVEVLEQVIPYLLLVQKGTEELAINDKQTYSDDDLTVVKERLQELLTEIKDVKTSPTAHVPMRVSQFDEVIKHLIPDLSSLFNKDLFEVAERNILAGLGFIDVIDSLSSSRRESVLNPKAFIEEVHKGVSDFKVLLNNLMGLIIEANKDHRKYANTTYYITSSPIRGFMTDDFKSMMRSLYDRGKLSSQTLVEVVGEVDFKTEVFRREKETRDGLDERLYPPVILNREGQGIDLNPFNPGGGTPEDETEEDIPDDKKGIEKENFTQSELVTAPYTSIGDLAPKIKKALTPKLQKIFIDVFNSAYQTYSDYDPTARETISFKVAWAQIRRMARRGQDGKWRLKPKFAKQIKAFYQELEKSSENREDPIELLIKLQKLEIAEKQSRLLDKLDKGGDKE